MVNPSIAAAEKAAALARKAVQLAEKTGDRMQLANATGNLAKAYIATKELGLAHDTAIRAGELHLEILGPANGTGLGMLAMAKKMKEQIDADLKKGVDWYRSVTCSACGDRFPWNLQIDKQFEAGLDFLATHCHTCGAEFRIDNPKD